MKINEITAANLIREISDIIDYDINIMNEEGIIIASTDTARVGQFHEGARRVITQNLSELPVYNDEAYSGCKKGINLPLSMYDVIIGVIGITGEVEETFRYARLIKKVTEILMKDMAALQKQSVREQAKILFVNSWLNGEVNDPAQVESQLQEYHVKSDGLLVVALISCKENPPLAAEFLSSKTDAYKVLVSHNNNTAIVVGNFSSPEGMQNYLESCFDRNFSSDQFVCAVGSCCCGYENARLSYQQARQVMSIKNGNPGGFYLYDRYHLEVILHQVPKYHKEQFVNRVFGVCQDSEQADFADFIDIYYSKNGSINGIAEELFIHKNTVQYKINKICQRTGLDLRILKDQIRLRLAGIWYRELLEQ